MQADFDEFDLPPALGDALREAYSHRGEIPAAAEAVVLGAAREKFERRRRARMLMRWGAGAAAAGLAAMIVLVVYVARPAPSTPVVVAAEKGDVNADGRVNMVDALALAKHLKAGDKVEAGWDVNGDGVVDAKDAEAIAVASVRLKQGGVAAARGLPRFEALGLPKTVAARARDAGEPVAAKVSLAEARPTGKVESATEVRR